MTAFQNKNSTPRLETAAARKEKIPTSSPPNYLETSPAAYIRPLCLVSPKPSFPVGSGSKTQQVQCIFIKESNKASVSRLLGRIWGPKRPHRHKDLTFWFQAPIKFGISENMLWRILMYYILYITYHVLYTIYYMFYTIYYIPC